MTFREQQKHDRRTNDRDTNRAQETNCRGETYDLFESIDTMIENYVFYTFSCSIYEQLY
jgi:hypothetical protein